jgi:hypothetical protein
LGLSGQLMFRKERPCFFATFPLAASACRKFLDISGPRWLRSITHDRSFLGFAEQVI